MAHKINSSRFDSIWRYHRYQLPTKFYPTFFPQGYFFTKIKLLTIIRVHTEITVVHIFSLPQILEKNVKISKHNIGFSYKGYLP